MNDWNLPFPKRAKSPWEQDSPDSPFLQVLPEEDKPPLNQTQLDELAAAFKRNALGPDAAPTPTQSPRPRTPDTRFADPEDYPNRAPEKPNVGGVTAEGLAKVAPAAQPAAPVVPPKPQVDPQEDRLRRLRGLKSMAEGLGKIGTAVERGSMIRAGISPNVVQPFVAEDTRNEIDREEDRLNPAEIEAYKGLGIDLDPGVRRSTLKSVSPVLGNSLQREKMAGVNDRFTKAGLQRGATEFERLTAVKNNAMAAARQARAAIDSGSETGINALKTLLQKSAGDTGNIGQYEQAQYATRVSVKHKIEDYINQVANGTILEERKDDIYKLLDAFEQQNDDFLNYMADKYANRLGNIYEIDPEEVKQKYLLPNGLFNAKGGSSPAETAPVTTSQPTRSEWVEMVDPKTGETQPVHRDDVEKGKAQGLRVK
jgi:hypothetical protein